MRWGTNLGTFTTHHSHSCNIPVWGTTLQKNASIPPAARNPGPTDKTNMPSRGVSSPQSTLTDSSVRRVGRSKRYLSCRNHQAHRLISLSSICHLGTPMKIFRQSTTPASDSCRAQTCGGVQKSRREVTHSGERRCMTQLDLKLMMVVAAHVFGRNGPCRWTCQNLSVARVHEASLSSFVITSTHIAHATPK